jgi:outer membrane protein OmpA-like peptidoglycan-associated protein
MIGARAHPVRRARWQVTLADLSLILVGFFVMLNAFQQRSAGDRIALASGLRGALSASPHPAAPTFAVAANRVDGFAPGSAALPPSIHAAAAWVRQSASDPRTSLIVTGRADPSEGSGLALPAARAEAVAAYLARSAAIDRARIRTVAESPGAGRVVDLAITYQPR